MLGGNSYGISDAAHQIVTSLKQQPTDSSIKLMSKAANILGSRCSSENVLRISVVVQACYPTTWKPEAGGSVVILGFSEFRTNTAYMRLSKHKEDEHYINMFIQIKGVLYITFCEQQGKNEAIL